METESVHVEIEDISGATVYNVFAGGRWIGSVQHRPDDSRCPRRIVARIFRARPQSFDFLDDYVDRYGQPVPYGDIRPSGVGTGEDPSELAFLFDAAVGAGFEPVEGQGG
jgi:hypothetical protein